MVRFSSLAILFFVFLIIFIVSAFIAILSYSLYCELLLVLVTVLFITSVLILIMVIIRRVQTGQLAALTSRTVNEQENQALTRPPNRGMNVPHRD